MLKTGDDDAIVVIVSAMRRVSVTASFLRQSKSMEHWPHPTNRS
jgi:hypothetical protein